MAPRGVFHDWEEASELRSSGESAFAFMERYRANSRGSGRATLLALYHPVRPGREGASMPRAKVFSQLDKAPTRTRRSLGERSNFGRQQPRGRIHDLNRSGLELELRQQHAQPARPDRLYHLVGKHRSYASI